MSRITSKAVFSDPKVLALCNCARGQRPVVLIPSTNTLLKNNNIEKKVTIDNKQEDLLLNEETKDESNQLHISTPSSSTISSSSSSSTSSISSSNKLEQQTDTILSDVLIHNSGWFFHSFHRHILTEEETKIICLRIKKQLKLMYPSLQFNDLLLTSSNQDNSSSSSSSSSASTAATVVTAPSSSTDAAATSTLSIDTSSSTINNDSDIPSTTLPVISSSSSSLIDKELGLTDTIDVNGRSLSLPPMVFGSDLLFIQGPLGSIQIDPIDALICWISQHTEEYMESRPLNVLKVPYAHKWQKRLQDDFHTNEDHATLPSPSHPSPSHPSPTHPSPTHPSPSPHLSSDSNDSIVSSTPIFTQLLDSDWTYTTDYICTLHKTNGHDELMKEATKLAEEITTTTPTTDSISTTIPTSIPSNPTVSNIPPHLPNPDPEALTIASTIFNLTSSLNLFDCEREIITPFSNSSHLKPANESGINMKMLTRKDLPILFYDELTLYEDDLEDCGEVSLEAKIRVMPTCWFLLLRFFLRIDNLIVRVREVRFYYEFPRNKNETNQLYIDVTWKEINLQTNHNHINNSTSPLSPSLSTVTSTTATTTSVASPSTTSSSLSAVYLKEKYSKTSMTNDWPIVNDKEGIHKHYVLTF